MTICPLLIAVNASEIVKGRELVDPFAYSLRTAVFRSCIKALTGTTRTTANSIYPEGPKHCASNFCLVVNKINGVINWLVSSSLLQQWLGVTKTTIHSALKAMKTLGQQLG